MRTFKAHKVPLPRLNLALPKTTLPIDIEIGAGAGMHAINYAKKHQERYLVAIERTKNKFQSFLNAYNKEKSSNLQILHADAVSWITHNIAPKSIENVYLLYPNPEPKNKNQRWIHQPFFSFLLERLKKDKGKIIITTNLKNYAQEFYDYAYSRWGLKNRKIFEPAITPFQARSNFEKKYLERGEKCYQVELLL